ncbi:PAS domain S-box-containing protein [Pectinatus brassicae]|uniref:PAS domain S-box-containing protein n=2 Tax=Pectinatus brassicae TaxID=862415 RepID=A0A840UJV6_9FIRM|nr:PAS domain S-box-containing protein [Pectinatus brassicae]
MLTYEYVSERMDYELPSGDKKNKKAFTENIIEYIFRILYRSKDANAATNLILEVIGRKYNISRAFILEKITEKKFSTTFEWCNDGIISRQNIEQNIPREVAMRFYKHFDEEGIFSYADIAVLPNDLKGFFSDSPVKAILECAIYDDKGDFYGGICFEYHQHPRCWTDEEIESLSFTAEILGTFLQQKRYMDSMNLSRVQALEILDHIDAFIYVIDKKTYEILFFNKKAAEFFGTDSLGKNCFNIICDEETKCSFCPIDLMAEALQSIKKDIYIAKRKIWLRIAVSKIYWQQNREVCLVHAHDITTMKNKQNKK